MSIAAPSDFQFQRSCRAAESAFCLARSSAMRRVWAAVAGLVVSPRTVMMLSSHTMYCGR